MGDKEIWKKYYEPPFSFDGYNYVWSKESTMTLMLDFGVPKELGERIALALNGEKDLTIPNLRHDEHEFFQGDKYIFCVRGWGSLTGIGGHNLSPEKAVEIQDSLIEYIFNTLTKEQV